MVWRHQGALALVIAALAGAEEHLAAAEAGASPALNQAGERKAGRRTPDASFEVMPPRTTAIAGQPVRLFVGIRNIGRSPLAFTSEPGMEWVASVSYTLDAKAGASSGTMGGSESSSPHAMVPGERWCPSGQDVLLLPPGARVFKMHEIKLDPGVSGIVTVELAIRVLRVPPSLECGPAEFIEGPARARLKTRQAGP
jgi:hypothetical protein